jgi:hypothetical protein
MLLNSFFLGVIGPVQMILFLLVIPVGVFLLGYWFGKKFNSKK